MRIIKHRGKTKDGEWVYGYYLPSIFEDVDIITVLEFFNLKQKNYHVLKETVGQFTGLTDKNGKEIYEGDIVRDSEGSISYVKWLIQRCGFVLVYERFDKDIAGSYGKIEYLEVIGNIHDNTIHN